MLSNLGGLRDLLGSERGIFMLMLAGASIMFVYLDRMTIEQWIGFNESLGFALVGSKTLTTTAEIMTRKKSPEQTTMTTDPAPSPTPTP